MTHSYIREMTNSYDSSQCTVPHLCSSAVALKISAVYVRHDAVMCGKWHVHMSHDGAIWHICAVVPSPLEYLRCIWDMTHSYIQRHDSFMGVWCDSFICARHDSFMCVWYESFICVCPYVRHDSFKWLISVLRDISVQLCASSTHTHTNSMWDTTHSFVRDMTRPYVCDMVHSYEFYACSVTTVCGCALHTALHIHSRTPILRETWLIHMCETWLIHMCVIWLIHMSFMRALGHKCAAVLFIYTHTYPFYLRPHSLICARHDSFICVWYSPFIWQISVLIDISVQLRA